MTTKNEMVSLAHEYFAYRRKLGFKLHREGQLLLRFAEFVDGSGHSGPITTDLALTWARMPEGTSQRYQAQRLDVVRGFARYRAIYDRATEIPPYRLIARAPRRSQPHIYSDAEIRQLIRAANELSPSESLRPHTYRTLFGILICTGLRLREVLRLKVHDVDLENGVITIVETKFYKSRLVVVHPSAVVQLREYADVRDSHHSTRRSDTFFVSTQGAALKYNAVRMTFRRICSRLGWESNVGRRRPRIYDFRHTFACRRLLEWYRKGTDVDNAIVSLSTYMGHTKVTDTYWYLSGVPELMEIAADRFEGFAHAHNEEIR